MTESQTKTIWVDADACPNMIKEVLFKASTRTKVPLILVANHAIRVPPIRWITTLQVSKGFDVADDEIVQRVVSGDLVITSDIPLADEVLTKGASVISPRGEELTKNNIRSRLNIRDFMDTMRSSGVQTGGPPALNNNDKQLFANALDRWLQRSH
ncbi:YaiI/YqxD family protein [Alteromonas sediminis]|nr:YaiI/YqxD family protein [Alteromonas sediminis]